MRRTNIYLDETQLTALRGVAERRDQPVAELVREAVGEWLEAQGVRVVEKDEWSARFDALLDRRRKLATDLDFDAQRVERDVATAIKRARRDRSNGAARRR